jgi:hypothetical protein
MPADTKTSTEPAGGADAAEQPAKSADEKSAAPPATTEGK